MTDKLTDARPAFFLIEDAIFDGFELTPYEGWLYVAILKHADRKTGEAFPGITRLSKLTHMSTSQVMRGITSLEEKGLLRVDRDSKPDKGEKRVRQVNHYFVLSASGSVYQQVGVVSDRKYPSVQQTVGVVSVGHINQNQLEPESINNTAPTAQPSSAPKPKPKTKPKQQPTVKPTEKKAVSNRKKLTGRSLWLSKLPPFKATVQEMLKVCYEGWDTIMMSPENSLTVPQLEKYITCAEEYERLGGKAENVASVYDFVADQVDHLIAPKTIADYFLRWKMQQVIPVKQQQESSMRQSPIGGIAQPVTVEERRAAAARLRAEREAIFGAKRSTSELKAVG